jgi:hypothetical protein
VIKVMNIELLQIPMVRDDDLQMYLQPEVKIGCVLTLK